MRITFLMLVFGLLFSGAAFGQASAKLSKATIKTSAQCGMCKKTIEAALADVAGIESAVLDVTSRKVKVRYDAKKTSVAEIREVISRTGYDADDVMANQQAHDALPACCQKGGEAMPGEEGHH